jgi:hypothetical protein
MGMQATAGLEAETDNAPDLDRQIRSELAEMVRRATRGAGTIRARVSLIADVRVSPEGDLRFERVVTARQV